MSGRISQVQRAQVANRAEKAIMEFALPDPATGLRPHALWHKHIHDAELDPMQVLKMCEMDLHPQTVDFSCRRTRKTSTKELWFLEKLATTPYCEEGIVAPRVQQSLTNMKYHLDAIDRSDALRSYLAHKNGRVQKTDGAYEFANKSRASAYGIMSQIDGDSLTDASLEETDDMPKDRLMARFLPMLGGRQRLGASNNDARPDPTIRLTGVFKGANVLSDLIGSGQYHQLPTVDVYMGKALGIINEGWVATMRAQQTSAEWIRQFLCKNIAATNWIHEWSIQFARTISLSAGLRAAQPMPGQRYKRRGLISFGYDHLGHGEEPTSSRSALVVCEQVGNFATFPFVYQWASDESESVIKRDLLAFWEYFMPDYAIGDAYGIGMLTGLNEALYARGLVERDVRTIGDGKSSASTWSDWAFAPMRFEGHTKHSMASVVRSAFHGRRAAIPFFDEEDEARPENDCWRRFRQQLGNMKDEPTQASYASFKMVEKRVGDDFFDATMAAVWAMATRGLDNTPTIIVPRFQGGDELYLATNDALPVADMPSFELDAEAIA